VEVPSDGSIAWVIVANLKRWRFEGMATPTAAGRVFQLTRIDSEQAVSGTMSTAE
jgi:hypothetical protein